MFTTENLDQNAGIHPRSPALKCQYFSIEDMNGSIITNQERKWKLGAITLLQSMDVLYLLTHSD